MKRILLLLIAGLVLGTAGFSQSNRSTRPRVAPTPTPASEPSDGPDPNFQQQNSGAPPVLRRQGGTNASGSPQATPTPKSANEDDEVVRVETNLVTMPVSVLDREGRFVSGLRQQDFKVFENGVEQKIGLFQTVEQPFTVVLMIDVSPSTQWQIEDIQNAAISFVQQLRPDDRVEVVAFDEHVQVLTRPTNDRYQLERAIRRANFGDGTSLYEAVDVVIRRELAAIQGRKAVVLFTDGVDTTSRRAGFDSTVAEAEESEALIYPIRFDTSREMMANGGGSYPGGGYPPIGRGGRMSLPDILGGIVLGGRFPGSGYPSGRAGRGGSRNEYETGRRYLEQLAQNSGGREFEADSLTNLDTAFSGIAEELRRQYSLGYYPDKPGQPGDRRQVSIRVARPGLVVRAKNSYIVGQGSQQQASK